MIDEQNNTNNQSIRCVHNKYLCCQFKRTQPIFMQNRDQNFTQNYMQVFWTKLENWAGLPLLMALWPISSGSPAFMNLIKNENSQKMYKCFCQKIGHSSRCSWRSGQSQRENYANKNKTNISFKQKRIFQTYL